MAPKSGSFGPIKSWTTGNWTSEVCDVSKLSFPSTGDNLWGRLRWYEENTEDVDEAYIKIDILSPDGTVLQLNKSGSVITNSTRFNRVIDLSTFANTAKVDVRIKFKLFSLTKQPIISNIELNAKNSW